MNKIRLSIFFLFAFSLFQSSIADLQADKICFVDTAEEYSFEDLTLDMTSEVFDNILDEYSNLFEGRTVSSSSSNTNRRVSLMISDDPRNLKKSGAISYEIYQKIKKRVLKLLKNSNECQSSCEAEKEDPKTRKRKRGSLAESILPGKKPRTHLDPVDENLIEKGKEKKQEVFDNPCDGIFNLLIKLQKAALEDDLLEVKRLEDVFLKEKLDNQSIQECEERFPMRFRTDCSVLYNNESVLNIGFFIDLRFFGTDLYELIRSQSFDVLSYYFNKIIEKSKALKDSDKRINHEITTEKPLIFSLFSLSNNENGAIDLSLIYHFLVSGEADLSSRDLRGMTLLDLLVDEREEAAYLGNFGRRLHIFNFIFSYLNTLEKDSREELMIKLFSRYKDDLFCTPLIRAIRGNLGNSKRMFFYIVLLVQLGALKYTFPIQTDEDGDLEDPEVAINHIIQLMSSHSVNNTDKLFEKLREYAKKLNEKYPKSLYIKG